MIAAVDRLRETNLDVELFALFLTAEKLGNECLMFFLYLRYTVERILKFKHFTKTRGLSINQTDIEVAPALIAEILGTVFEN